ncbi:MAG: polysaccharide deacetylase family protein, partial [Sphingomonadales bacterium]
MIHRIFLFFFLIFSYSAEAFTQESHEDSSVVFLVYHRFGENDFPSTNVQINQFKEQLKILIEGGHSFPNIADTLENLKNKTLHPKKSVVITVDDGYKSVMTEAWPLLKKHNIPLTLFIATDSIDSGNKNYLTWDDIRQLISEGVTISHHGADHGHAPQRSIKSFKTDTLKANKRFQEELGFIPKIYAYPYGEYTPDIQNTLRSLGLKFAFAQFSGASGPQNDLLAIPRFAINENYSDIPRFRLIVNSLSLPINDILPDNPVLSQDNNPPSFGFSLEESITNIRDLACYP